MKNKIIATILAMMMSVSSTTFAQEFDPDPGNEDTEYYRSELPLNLPPVPTPLKLEPDVGEAVSPMKKGQTAPFTGLLFSPAAVAKIISDIESRQVEIDLAVNHATNRLTARHKYDMDVFKIRFDSDAKINQIRIDAQKKEIERLDARLKQEKEQQPNVLVWTAIGIGAGVILSTLTAAVVVSVTNNN